MSEYSLVATKAGVLGVKSTRGLQVPQFDVSDHWCVAPGESPVVVPSWASRGNLVVAPSSQRLVVEGGSVVLTHGQRAEVSGGDVVVGPGAVAIVIGEKRGFIAVADGGLAFVNAPYLVDVAYGGLAVVDRADGCAVRSGGVALLLDPGADAMEREEGGRVYGWNHFARAARHYAEERGVSYMAGQWSRFELEPILSLGGDLARVLQVVYDTDEANCVTRRDEGSDEAYSIHPADAVAICMDLAPEGGEQE